MKNQKNPLVAAALAGMLSATVGTASLAKPAAAPKAASKEQVPCYGVNACGGKGNFCGVPGSHACHGRNSCKGKGLMMMDKEECLKKGGEVADSAWKKKMKEAKKG